MVGSRGRVVDCGSWMVCGVWGVVRLMCVVAGCTRTLSIRYAMKAARVAPLAKATARCDEIGAAGMA